MIVELKPAQYENARSLFDGLWYHLNLFAVIEGKCPGQIFADDAASPTVALICEQVEGNWYLAGDSSNPEVVEGLRSLIAETLLPAGRARDGMVELLVNWHPETWEAQFGALLAGASPMRHLRKHFVIDQTPDIDWRAQLPDGYEMRLVDDEVLMRNERVNIERLRDWGSGSHDAMKPLMGDGVGCCIFHDNHIASWCMGDYAAGNAVEVGIHTDDAYRKQGLATLATAAMVETCLVSGADYVGWHCWSSNIASAKTALKVGFRQTVEHPIHHAWYNRVDNQFVRGNMLKFEFGQPEAAVVEYATGFQMIEDGHRDVASSRFVANWLPWAHYNMACALATTGDAPTALAHLDLAIDSGYDDRDQLRNEPELAPLRQLPAWSELMARLSGS